MIGKIFFNNEWRICRFENNKLEILRVSCDIPLWLQNKAFAPFDFAVAQFEDGYFYFFDLSNGLTEVKNEYVQFEQKVQSFFKSCSPFFRGEFNLSSFEKIIFKNGALMPMITSEVPKFEIEIDGLAIQIEFGLKQVDDDFLCSTDFGTMLSNYPTSKTDYALVASLSHAVDLSELSRITKKLYKIIQFINVDFNAPIGSIIVKTNIGDLLYNHNEINLTNVPVIKRFNYIGNCEKYIREIAQNLVRDTCDVGFISLIDKDNFIDNDYWLLGQSLETNIPNDIENKLETAELKNEINFSIKLHEEIKNTIDEFEKKNGKIDKDRRSFIFSSIKIADFRKKAEFVFEKYNDFAKQCGKYKQFDSSDLNKYSKLLQSARNTIHNSKKKPYNEDEIEFSVVLCIVGLYIYILENSGAPTSCIFNLIQCFYP